MKTPNSNQNREVVTKALSGWVMLPVSLALIIGCTTLFIMSIVRSSEHPGGHPEWSWFVLGLIGQLIGYISLGGFFSLQPNQARVLILFGNYVGTVRDSGFFWVNPFYYNGPRRMMGTAGTNQSVVMSTSNRNKISLRARNLNGDKLKVNDKRGNPIEIAAVVVWRVEDTAQATFDVEDFENYVHVQSESAVRHLASAYAYDHGEENEVTLRSGVEEVSQALKDELNQRLGKAGVVVEEARLTHLAYAPEIAQAMLRRQQAEAVIAARRTIVQGAVSMVDMALKELASKQVVQLDDERRASMVSNLMVVLCSENETHPVINTGTLYT